MKKVIKTLCAILLASSFAYAQEDFEFEGFGSDSSDGDFGGFDSDGFGSASADSEPALAWSGELAAKTRTWFNMKDGYDSMSEFFDSSTQQNAYFRLGLDYSGSRSDISVKLKADTATIKEHPEDILEEASIRGFFGNFTVEAGKMKNVWGKGDKVHVLDNFNANDYTDFIFPDYIDRRLSEVMLKASYAFPTDANIKIEGVYTPTMTADRFASSGILRPARMITLENTIKSTVSSMITDIPSMIKYSSFNANDLYVDTNTLRFGQLGLRVTGTVGGFDWGASYYYGHIKQPSANLYGIIAPTVYKTAALKAQAAAQAASTAATTAATAGQAAAAQAYAAQAAAYAQYATNYATLASSSFSMPVLDYDAVEVFGLEMATILWKFNTRAEIAYNLTNDITGDDPWVKNNWFSWVAGFDIDLPIHNLNINIQETGSIIVNHQNIGDRKIDLGNGTSYSLEKYDVDYNSDDCYHKNKIIFLLKDTFMNEKISLELQGIWGIENKEFVLIPKFNINVIDGLSFNAQIAYMYSDNENGEFYQFTAANTEHHNQLFVQLGAKYSF